MPENQQVQQPESSPEPAQPAGPSAEAAPVAAAAAAPTEDALAEYQKRLSRQQGILDRRRAEAERLANAERVRAEALQGQLDAERMKGMNEQQRLAFQSEREQDRIEGERQQLMQERTALEEDRMYMQWHSWFVSQGVPGEKLQDCQTFAEMQQAYAEHMGSLVEQAKQGPAPPEAPKQPDIGPADHVHGAASGAPPSGEWDKMIAEGGRPGTKEFREQVRRQKRSGQKHLV